jgi:tetratricopeptide (TPR) repeat protein
VTARLVKWEDPRFMTGRDQQPTVDESRGRTKPDALARGTAVGRYLLLEVLGEGGMGVVYTAYDPELDRQIALKLLTTDEQAGTREQLVREAQALARLSHPNIVAVHDVGTTEAGAQVFIAMELVRGQTLAAWLKEQPRTIGELLAVFVEAGEGLAAAHRAGLVHRDFKPDNVMIGADGRARVVDFGVARAAHGDPAGAIIGTPRFMAPEQHRGQPVDERADQFSFCVSLYWALYDGLPFAGETPEAYREGVLAGRILEAPAGSRVPRWLRQVVLRGLALEPAQRHPSMAALLTALKADPGERRRKWQRGALLVGLAGAALGTLALAERRQLSTCRGAERRLAGVWDDARRSSVRAAFLAGGRPYAEAVLRTVERTFDDYANRWVAMNVDACEATHVRHEQSAELLDLRMSCLSDELTQLQTLGELFSHADAALVERAAQTAGSLPALARCSNVAGLRAPAPPPEDARARQKLKEVRQELAQIRALDLAGRYDEGLRRATTALESAVTLGYRPLVAEAQLGLGELEVDRGDFGQAIGPLRHALVAALAGRHDEVAASAAIRLMEATGLGLQHFEEGDTWADLASASVERLQERDPLLGVFYETRAGLRRQEGRTDDALSDAQRALESELRLRGPDHHQVALAYRALGDAQYVKARYAQALDSFQRAAAIDERALGPEHPELTGTWVGMANVYSDTGESDRAQALYARALRLFERINPDHPDLASIYNNMGDDLESQGKLHEAHERYARALEVAERTRGPSRSTAIALIHLGSVENALGRPEAAVRRFQEALAMAERAVGPDHHVYGRALYQMAAAHRRLGRLDLALTEYRRALPILDKALDPMHPEIAEPLLGLARTLLDRHEPRAAIAPLERAEKIYVARGEPYRGELAIVRFAMAQALWQSGERPRARALATEASRGFAAERDRKEELAAVAAWLARHR